VVPVSTFYSHVLLGAPLYQILWFFLLYSFCGVIIEGIFFLVRERVLESRVGLLYLPLRPLYGAGGVAYTLLLRPVLDHPALVFLLGLLVGTVVEYVAGAMIDRAFGAVSWDYSDKVLNLNGRVCLQFSIAWGLLALLALCVLDGPLTRLVDVAASPAGDRVLTVLMVVVLLSSVLTLAALGRVRRRVDALRAGAAGVGGMRSDSGWTRLVDRMAPDPVMINTFPRMSLLLELMELTGQQRAWLRLPVPLGLRWASDRSADRASA
jgi:uncharacterized membrane protein